MVGKSVWGPAVWYLFHTLAFKMKSQHFNETKNSLLDFFVLITANLPCPECTEHAQQEVKKLDKSKITNKKELCTYFCNFHNKVNFRTKKKIFTIEEYVSKYKNSVTRNVISNFFISMTKSDHNVKLMINSFYKSNAIASLKKWIMQNHSKFNP
jgi:hypothetical protein